MHMTSCSGSVGYTLEDDIMLGQPGFWFSVVFLGSKPVPFQRVTLTYI